MEVGEVAAKAIADPHGQSADLPVAPLREPPGPEVGVAVGARCDDVFIWIVERVDVAGPPASPWGGAGLGGERASKRLVAGRGHNPVVVGPVALRVSVW